MEVLHIEISKKAQKQLNKVPKWIREALFIWMNRVKKIGLEETRKFKGYHDEPLKGLRMGERSIRLNRGYRAIYLIWELDGKKILEISEVSKHKY